MGSLSVQGLPKLARAAAQEFATRMAQRGHRAWLVGGVVRDLARNMGPSDLDFASAATPDEVEALYPRAVGVGRRFGTVVVPLDGATVEHTTFRTEGDYTDGRRPDRLAFGTSLEEDAARRDFTCNALYLDPLTDEVRDPTGGLADIDDRTLRAVGVAADRFREDGLRLLRLARFSGKLAFRVDPATLEGARAARDALTALAPERVLAEWERIAAGGGVERAIAVLLEAELLRGALPGIDALSIDGSGLRLRAALVERLAHRREDAGPLEVGSILAALYDPGAPYDDARIGLALAALDHLKPSKALRKRVVQHLQVLAALVARPGEAEWELRARRREALIAPANTQLVAFAMAHNDVHTQAQRDGAGEMVELALSGDSQVSPAPLLSSADLAALGLAPGPKMGEILGQVRRRQLGGVITSRDEALAFARDRIRPAADG